MTVIAAMKFNPSHGAMVADEQVMYGWRKIEIADKIFSDSVDGWLSYAIGSSGVCSLAEEVLQVVPKAIRKEREETYKLPGDEQFTVREAANLFAEEALRFRKEYLSKYFEKHFRLSEDDFRHGQFKKEEDDEDAVLSDKMIGKYFDLIGPEGKLTLELPLGLVIMVKPVKENLGLYSFDAYDNGTLDPSSLPYLVSGSGSDTADIVLADFLEDLPRRKHADINPLNGLAALLRATYKAGKRNIGVGGAPSIRILHDDKILMPDENASRLGMYIAQATQKGYISEELQKEVLQGLFYGGVDWRDVESELWKKTKDSDVLRRYLLGFRE